MVNMNKIISFKIKYQAKFISMNDVKRTVGVIDLDIVEKKKAVFV